MMFLLVPLTAILAYLSLELSVGLVLAVLPMYLLKSALFGIPVTALEMLILGAAIGGAWRIYRNRERPRGFGRLTVPVAALVAVWLASAALSSDLQAGLGAVKAWLLEPMLLALLALNAPRTERARWTMLGGLIVGAVGFSLYGLMEKLFGFGLPPDGRLNSVFEPANYHAMLTAPILALCIPFVRRGGGQIRWALLAAASVIGLGLLLTASYGAFLGIAAALLVWIVTLPSPKRRVGLLALAVVTVLAILSQVGTEKFSLLGKLHERSSSAVRVQIWHSAWEITRQHPVLGVGLNAFETPYREAVAKLYWPPLEWLVAQPHNLYLALTSETGFLGFAAFVWLLVVWWRLAVHRFQTLQQRPWALAALLSLTVILVHGLVDTPVLKNDLSALLAFILTLPFLKFEEGPGTTPS
jgi:putative inorganic carbon (HCO3(-)) transporter